MLAISTGVTQLSVEYCHFKIDPVYPERVRRVLLVPVHTEVEPAMEPPTEMGSTVTFFTVGDDAEHPFPLK